MRRRSNKEKPLFARNINWLRNQLKLTTREACIRSGIKESTWKSYEEGRAAPRLQNMPDLCRALEYYDLYAMMTRDLATANNEIRVDRDKAIESLLTIKSFLEQIKTKVA